MFDPARTGSASLGQKNCAVNMVVSQQLKIATALQRTEREGSDSVRKFKERSLRDRSRAFCSAATLNVDHFDTSIGSTLL